MIRIRRILSAAHNGAAVAEVQEIFRARFPYAAAYADQILQILDQPFERGYRTVLVVAEGDLGKVRGFSMVLHFPGIRAAFLDFLAVAPGSRGKGIGSNVISVAVPAGETPGAARRLSIIHRSARRKRS